MIQKIVKSSLNYFGLEIRKKKYRTIVQDNKFTMLSAIKRMKKRGLNPITIMDIGAAEGKWTKDVMQIWPDSTYCLFEPLEERKAELSALKNQFKNVYYLAQGASNTVGEISFYVTDDLDGSGVADNGSNAMLRKIKTTTIDQEVTNLKLNGPFVIKLDTHGYEVPILEGAINTLKYTELIIVECYGFKIAPNSLLFWEMCSYMQTKGFRLVEIVDLVNRSKDDVFWQCDAFFIPYSSSCFSSNTYH